ncbi:MAG TPA: addiction module protein [Bacteroidota bacterium]
MDMTPHDIETEVLKLNPSARAKLAEKLLQSLETLSDQENEKLWAEEALRRHQEILNGTATMIPAETVFQEARKRVG